MAIKNNTNHFGKTSTLRISTKTDGTKTILDDIYFTSPYKLLPPFYTDSSPFAHAMMISVSAGLMEGDRQEVYIKVNKDTNLICTSQAFEKIHKMNNGDAKRTIKLEVDSNATLWYEPLPAIPFADSAFTNHVDIQLKDDTARFALTDIMCAGRIAYGEAFKYKYYNSKITAHISNELVFFDNTHFNPAKCQLNNIGMFEGYSHLATILLLNFTLSADTQTDLYCEINKNPDITGGISEIEHGFVIKILGKSAEQLQNIVKYLKNLLNIF